MRAAIIAAIIGLGKVAIAATYGDAMGYGYGTPSPEVIPAAPEMEIMPSPVPSPEPTPEPSPEPTPVPEGCPPVPCEPGDKQFCIPENPLYNEGDINRCCEDDFCSICHENGCNMCCDEFFKLDYADACRPCCLVDPKAEFCTDFTGPQRCNDGSNPLGVLVKDHPFYSKELSDALMALLGDKMVMSCY